MNLSISTLRPTRDDSSGVAGNFRQGVRQSVAYSFLSIPVQLSYHARRPYNQKNLTNKATVMHILRAGFVRSL